MHVMSRRRNESVVIGEDIVVTVLEVRGDRVQLAIDFPPEMPLELKEFYEARLREDAAEELLVGE